MAMSQVNQFVIDCGRELQAAVFFAWYEGALPSG